MHNCWPRPLPLLTVWVTKHRGFAISQLQQGPWQLNPSLTCFAKLEWQTFGLSLLFMYESGTSLWNCSLIVPFLLLHLPLMFTAGSTIDIFGLLVLLCVVAGSNRWSWKTAEKMCWIYSQSGGLGKRLSILSYWQSTRNCLQQLRKFILLRESSKSHSNCSCCVIKKKSLLHAAEYEKALIMWKDMETTIKPSFNRVLMYMIKVI